MTPATTNTGASTAPVTALPATTAAGIILFNFFPKNNADVGYPTHV